MKYSVLRYLLSAFALLLFNSNVQAQPHHSNNRLHGVISGGHRNTTRSHTRTSGYQFNSRSHTVGDRYGYSYGTYHKDIIRPSYQYIIPHRNARQNGTYFHDNGSYYYYPQTYSLRPDQHLNVRPQKIVFGTYARTKDLGERLESLANDFCLELHANYRNNRDFDNTYREAYRILEIAKYIHKEVHDGHRGEIAREVGKLDELFHHVQAEVTPWRSARDHHNAGAGIQSHLALLESTIHHLMNDAGVRPKHGNAIDNGHGHKTNQAPAPPRIAPPPIN